MYFSVVLQLAVQWSPNVHYQNIVFHYLLNECNVFLSKQILKNALQLMNITFLTKYIYSSTEGKYSSKVLVLYLHI